jgi:hypothetical protein
MSEKMVRTQVYLPREVHATLTQRAEEQGLTLADQIRTALHEYLARVETEKDGVILEPDDPLFQMMGMFDSGIDDLGLNHDYYLYGAARKPMPQPHSIAEPKPTALQPPARKSSRARKKSKLGFSRIPRPYSICMTGARPPMPRPGKPLKVCSACALRSMSRTMSWMRP